MYNKKYRLDRVEEFNRHNPLYDGLLGSTCYLVYLNEGERGWFLYEGCAWFEPPHRVHTYVVKNVDYTRGNQVIVTTQNTRFTFTLLVGEELK
jgi:hypothetical protein